MCQLYFTSRRSRYAAKNNYKVEFSTYLFCLQLQANNLYRNEHRVAAILVFICIYREQQPQRWTSCLCSFAAHGNRFYVLKNHVKGKKKTKILFKFYELFSCGPLDSL